MDNARALEQREPWSAVLALGITQITAWGTIYYLFPLLMDPLPSALGASRSSVVGAFTLSLLISVPSVRD